MEPPTVNGDTDPELEAVVNAIVSLDPGGNRISRVMRSTFDQLYDGQRTGRYSIDQLRKTEKTHFGSFIEINLQTELDFADGDTLDFKIANTEVDCKFSFSGQWMLPPESFDQLVLVTEARDHASDWSLGVVRATESNRRVGQNRDAKTGLNKRGREQIRWIFKDHPLPPNALLQAPLGVVDQILAPTSGQKRVNELFRRLRDKRLSRTVVATVARQADYMKRVRENGGARTALRPEGILILGGDFQGQAQVAAALGTEVPTHGEFVSVRVTPAQAENGVLIDGGWWRRAHDDEQTAAPAPRLLHRVNRT